MTGGWISTFTGIVRAYDGEFARSLPPLQGAATANVDALHEAWRQRRLVVEIPAVLNWSGQESRRSRHRVFGLGALRESAHVIRQGVRLHRLARRLGSPKLGAAVIPIRGATTFASADPGEARAS